ncbi:MAG: acyl-CoA/acyl-ACP dehydrogenase [Deltaproteobacteria bacterium]|nr:acyl-CoA/acyl-ACP dehydrogenase [Deltaproteobacteria bacterium]MBW2206187.1 acyl-CoA/acyl-ACP dehydrogenase [Deltaproteobacteria bacterium]
MDFKLNNEQDAIQKAAEEFAKGEFDRDIALEHELAHSFPFDIWKKACELGFIGLHFPEELGGQDYGILENALVVEAFCRQDSGLGIALSLADFASEIILRCGTDEQKEKYLRPLISGEAISCGGFTEPDHGSDITFMNTSAVKDGNDYVINGGKTFITNGTIGQYVIVLCQTDPEATPTYRGQSVIIVEKETEGFSASDVGHKMGIKMTSTAELVFNDVRVPAANLVGEENKGFYQVLEFFDESRVEIAAQALGIAQGSFDRAMAYTKERKQFGKKLSQFQVTQHKLADMITKIETARLIVYKAGWNYDQGHIDPKLTSMAKMYAGRVAVEVADEAIQLLGGYGYMLENEVERFYRDAKIMEIYEGTREIQKNTIASAILGKQ